MNGDGRGGAGQRFSGRNLRRGAPPTSRPDPPRRAPERPILPSTACSEVRCRGHHQAGGQAEQEGERERFMGIGRSAFQTDRAPCRRLRTRLPVRRRRRGFARTLRYPPAPTRSLTSMMCGGLGGRILTLPPNSRSGLSGLAAQILGARSRMAGPLGLVVHSSGRGRPRSQEGQCRDAPGKGGPIQNLRGPVFVSPIFTTQIFSATDRVL